jgi:hypothetical protein
MPATIEASFTLSAMAVQSIAFSGRPAGA